jgi:Predicted metal-dependent enzyme
MILMLLLGIIIGFFIPFSNPFLRTFCKLLCLPIVVSIGYELIKLCGKYDNVLTRIIAAPGLWFQRLTVKEPTDKMMEAAIAAMKAVIPENGEDIIR